MKGTANNKSDVASPDLAWRYHARLAPRGGPRPSNLDIVKEGGKGMG